MKGIKKYNGKLYKRAKNKNLIKKGDVVQLLCKRGSSYFAYNGIYEVVSDPYPLMDGRMSGPEIVIPKEIYGGEYNLGLKLGYNVGNSEWFKLVEYIRPKKATPELDYYNCYLLTEEERNKINLEICQ